VQGSTVRCDVGLEAKTLAGGQNRGAVAADRPGQQDDVARLGAAGAGIRAGQPPPQPGGGDVEAVGGAATDHLGVAGDDRHPDRASGGDD
jgi:hypothetical protein